MRLVLVEARIFAMRLARRRLVWVALALDTAAVAWLVVSPAGSPRAAFAAAHGLGVLTVLVLGSGCVADDLSAGRLIPGATHPVPRAAWILGRWLAVAMAAAAVTVVAGVVAVWAGPGAASSGSIALGAAASAAHVGALAALAVMLSCGAGGTAQVLVLLGVLVIGLVPPAVVAGAFARAWLEPALRVAWAALPTPWALDRVQGWALGVEGAHPLLVVALAAQPAVWLAAGTRVLRQAELGARGL